MQFRQFIIQKIKSYYLVIAYKSPIYHVYGIPYTTANCMSVCCQTDDVLHMHIYRQSFDMQANMPWFKIRTVDNLTNSFKGDTLTPTPPMPMCPDVVELVCRAGYLLILHNLSASQVKSEWSLQDIVMTVTMYFTSVFKGNLMGNITMFICTGEY